MYFLVFYLLLAAVPHIVVDLIGLGPIYKIIGMGPILVAFALDYSRTIALPERNTKWPLILFLTFFGGLFLIREHIFADPLDRASIANFLVLVVFPFLAIVMNGMFGLPKNLLRPPPLGVPPLWLGLLFLMTFALMLSFVPGLDVTYRIYGQEELRGTGILIEGRKALALFRGVVLGGTMGSLLFCGSFAGLIYTSDKWKKLIFCAGCLIGLICVIITDVRMALLVCVLTIPMVILVRRYGSKTGHYLFYICLLISIASPFIYPPISRQIENNVPQALNERLGRGSVNSIVTLSGRTEAWTILADVEHTILQVFIGISPSGELDSGKAVEIAHTTGGFLMDPGRWHSHNTIINLFYTSGLIGVGVYVAFVCWLGYQLLRSNSLNSKVYFFVLLGIILNSTIESLVRSGVFYVFVLLVLIGYSIVYGHSKTINSKNC